jgi:hypothetical protein
MSEGTKSVATKPTEVTITVGVATTFALLAFAGFWLRTSCDLTLSLSAFERDVCDSGGWYALILIALPVVVLLAGSMSRRAGWPFIFYSTWAAALAFGLAVVVWIAVEM